MKRTYVMYGGDLVEVWRAPARKRVHIIGDSHPAFRSMADGKMYDSKSRYRAEIKARGFEEVGGERKAVMAAPEWKSDGVPELHEAAGELGMSL